MSNARFNSSETKLPKNELFKLSSQLNVPKQEWQTKGETII